MEQSGSLPAEDASLHALIQQPVGALAVGNLTNQNHPSAEEFERAKMLLNSLFGSRVLKTPAGEMLPDIIVSALETYPCLVSGEESLGLRLAQLAVDTYAGEEGLLFEKAAYRLIAEIIPLNKRRLIQELREAVTASSSDKFRGYSRHFPWMIETYLTELTTPFMRRPEEFIYDLSNAERKELTQLIDTLKASPHAEEFDWVKLEAIKRRLLS